MTPRGCTFLRFAFSLVAALPLALATAPRPAAAQPPPERTPRETIAYVPGAVWGSDLESATGELKLDRHAIYWFEGGDDMGRVIGDRERYQADDAKAAPREALVAFAGRYSAAPTEPMGPGVAVMDTTGVLLADFPRGRSYAWSPDGTRLAVVFPREAAPRGRSRRSKARAVRYRPGVAVWDRRDGSVRSYDRWPSHAAWAGDSLLLQVRDSVIVLDPRKGAVARTGHRGSIVSPDSRYSLWVAEDGESTRVHRDGRGSRSLRAAFGAGDPGEIRSVFWVRGRGADHLICASLCDRRSGASCRIEVVDVETGETVESFPGEALGPTADERGVVIFHRGSGRLEYHDLRPVARERAESRERDESRDRHDRREDSAEFH